MYGWASTPAYTLTTSFGTSTALDAGVVTEGATSGAGQWLYSFTFPGNASGTSAFVSVSVVSDLGTSLYLSPYGQTPAASVFTWSSFANLAVQLLQLPTASICGGPAFSYAIPGSSPPLCQLNVLVTTRQSTVYRLSVAGAQSVVPLVAGQQVEGAASAQQSATFSFSVPDNLSNVTLLVAVTNAATDVALTIGPETTVSVGSFRAIWTVTQQPGQSLVAFTLDYTNPLLVVRNVVAGTYRVVVSTQQNATFSVSYSLTNATGHGGTIVPLLDGVAQQSSLQPGQYAFFFLAALPTTGWPYSVTLTTSWQRGFGRVLVGVGDGTQAGPLPGSPLLLTSSAPPLLVMSPNSSVVCGPSTVLPSGLPCGWAVSVLADPSAQGPVQFTVTATTGAWIRTLSVSSAASNPPSASQLSAGAVDLWQVPAVAAYIPGTSLMLVVSVSGGAVAVFASNATAAPNASQAQYSLPRVDGVDCMQIIITPNAVIVPYYFSVVCAGGAVCAYTLQASVFYPQALLYQVSPQQSPVLAIPPGGLLYAFFYTVGLSSIAFLTLQVEPVLGSANLYVGCFHAGFQDDDDFPTDQAHSTWSALGPGPLALEVTNLPANVSTDCPYFIVGVRATGTTSLVGSLQLSIAGVQQRLSGIAVGLVTPVYPASYLSYQFFNPDPTAVLTFTLAVTPASCAATTQLLVSANAGVQQPSLAVPGLTYTFLGSLLTLDTGAQLTTVVVSNASTPAGSLRPGPYYLAVVGSSATATCQYAVESAVDTDTRLVGVGRAAYTTLVAGSPGYFSFSLPANTAATFALSAPTGTAVTQLYVGVDSRPVPSDLSTYAMVAAVTSAATMRPVPVYLPADTCAVGVCTIFVAAVTSAARLTVGLLPTTSAGAVWLSSGQGYASLNASSSYTSYQFSLPSSPQTVSVSVQSSAVTSVVCSYQYVTPDAASYDWMSGASTAGQATTLSFQWSAALQLNPSTALASAPTTCYCAVLPSNAFLPYSIVFTSAPAQSSSSSGLSGGALAAAVVVPVVCAALLMAALWWVWGRGGCRRWVEERKETGGSDGSAWTRHEESGGAREASEVPMADLNPRWGKAASPKATGSQSMLNQSWDSAA